MLAGTMRSVINSASQRNVVRSVYLRASTLSFVQTRQRAASRVAQIHAANRTRHRVSASLINPFQFSLKY